MRRNLLHTARLTWLVGCLALPAARADNLDLVGARLLRQVDPFLLGNGVSVAQTEGVEASNSPPPFEVSPAATGQPESRFTYRSALGAATNFPNAVGAESGHADGVGRNFYGNADGVSPQVAHVDNYEADFFYTNIISPVSPPAIAARVVNQSFIFEVADTDTANQHYDNYAAQQGTLFVSGVGNGDVPVSAAGTCYNGIGVGVVDGNSSAGPTADGRCKPDITGPGGATSFSTPYVAGAAAVLLQAAARGDGGTNLAAAGDARTVKALLLNGAVKPAGWTNGSAAPLDGRYGAGIVNVFNAWHQLGGGRHSLIESTTNSSGGAHPPGTSQADLAALTGWDFATLTNPAGPGGHQERVNHYYFSLPAVAGPAFTLTATLVWQRPSGQSAINDLDLYLYHMASGILVTGSTSAVDNVEHLFVPSLPAGRYDLQVLLRGGFNQVAASETYALAFEFFTMPLSLALTNGQLLLSWPLAPTGFRLESTDRLAPPIAWTNVPATPAITNNQNQVLLPAADGPRFFRLQRP